MKSEVKIQELKEYNKALVERVKIIKKTFYITTNDLAKASGIASNTIQRQLSLYNSLDTRVLTALLELAPTVSGRWLLTGSDEIGTFVPQKRSSTDIDLQELNERIKRVESILANVDRRLLENNQ